MNTKIIRFISHGDNRGKLVAINGGIDIPFDIKRVYYIYETSREVIRGKHSHKTLAQVLICISGSCEILLDDGNEKQYIVLNKPFEGLYIGNNIWREMSNFSSGTVLMVLASNKFDENDYIRDYKDFLKYVGKEKERK